MPGTQIVLKSDQPDPDPSAYLYISQDLKDKNMAKVYDPKKSCWVPDEEKLFVEGMIQEVSGNKVTVMLLHDKSTKEFKQDKVDQVNPPKFEMCEDMSNLTHLNEASVLWNLKARYQNELIHTYSGLFAVVVNPYKRFPIYTQRAVGLYRNKRRNECPPHIFGVAEGCYHAMVMLAKNQSILITGESGAGKTENTKKVITYFASVGGSGKKSDTKKASLEDQIVQTNPVLEAYGNAKTVRNDNSSRFGKFIRVWFNSQGKMAGGDIESYLLEKSRVTYQSPDERSFHIWYFLLHDPKIVECCQLKPDIYQYGLVAMGKVTVPSIDDAEEMRLMDEAFDILGFTSEEKTNVYKVSSMVMHLSNMTFQAHGETSSPLNLDTANILVDMTGCGEAADFADRFCQPKIKVGTEWVVKSLSKAAAENSTQSIARDIFGRVFRYLIDMCNNTLIDPTMKKVNFIGVLDIAGFEIFEFNTFEQLCINFVNEKLQQFFNHHMFVVEQEEYTREGIVWESVDFGMDLIKCIELFEKPMGVLPILEEETIYPKATDKTLEEKLKANHLGKHPNFCRPPPKTPDKDAHFAVAHYAGTVAYNVTGWLEKNKDPTNDTVVDILKKSSSLTLLQEMYMDNPGQSPMEDNAPAPGHRRPKKRIVVKSKTAAKMANFKTVCAYFKDQLNQLMMILESTEPSFIRCIVPNNHKQPGAVDPYLVMHQLTCNGVLEGIRICRKGFPNRLSYKDFRNRYAILCPKDCDKAAKTVKRPVTEEKKDIAASHAVMDFVGMVEGKFQYGHTKIFFRAGVLGEMEEIRDEHVQVQNIKFKSRLRAFLAQREYYPKWRHTTSLFVAQKSIRILMVGKTWKWLQLYLGIKPMLKAGNVNKFRKEITERIAYAKEHTDDMIGMREKEEAKNGVIKGEMEGLRNNLLGGAGAKDELINKCTKMEDKMSQLQKSVDQTKNKVKKEQENCEGMEQSLTKIERDQGSMASEIRMLESKLATADNDRATKDNQIKALKDEIMQQEELISKLGREKKQVNELKCKGEEQLQTYDDKCNALNKIKLRLEKQLDELEDSLEREKRIISDTEKIKRKNEADLKLSQETISDLEKGKADLSTVITRKEKEMGSLSAKIDDEGTLIIKSTKQIKELHTRLEELDEELANERNSRARAEKGRSTMRRDLDELQEKVEECGAATSTQIALNARREEELAKLKTDLDEMNISHESCLAMMRQKHNSVISEMGEQIDSVNKAKTKGEMEKGKLQMEIEENRGYLESIQIERANAERIGKSIQSSIGDKVSRLSDQMRALNDADSHLKKFTVENNELNRQLEEAERSNNQMNKDKASLTTQLEDARRLAEAETRDRVSLLSKMKNIEHDLGIMKEELEVENDAKVEIQKHLSKQLSDAQLWQTRYETEGVARCEELERDKGKITARLSEAEEAISGLHEKIALLEKSKSRMMADFEEITNECDRANTNANVMEKRAQNYERVVNEWQLKADDLLAEINAAQTESRNYSSEYYRIKTAHEEAMEHLDTVKRENKNLSEEIKDLLDQLGEGGRSMHELDKQRRRLEVEKDELQAALEEAESALEQEENRVTKAQFEMAQVRQEIDKRIAEKEEEFENTRKNHQRALDSMQASLEAESRAKEEALRMKKKLESDINEMEIGLDHANKANAEAKKAIKRYTNQHGEIQCSLAEAKKMTNEAREKLGISQRKAGALAGEMEESKTLLEAALRGQKQVQVELADTTQQGEECKIANNTALSAKRKVESDVNQLQADLENLVTIAKNNEEKAKKAMVDASRLADELRAEQDHTNSEEKMIKAMDIQMTELNMKMQDLEQDAARGGRAMLIKMETKAKELEVNLASTSMGTAETSKATLRTERKIKELSFQDDEEKKNQGRMSELVNKLQEKIRTYKKQIEEAEEIAALNLAKFRKAQQELEEAEERGRIAEDGMARVRFDRAGSAF